MQSQSISHNPLIVDFVFIKSFLIFTPALMKRTLEQKNEGWYFSEDQITSLQLLYANFRVAHSIEPTMKAFHNGLASREFTEVIKIIRTNDRIAKIVASEETNSSKESHLLEKISQKLLSNRNTSSVTDLRTRYTQVSFIIICRGILSDAERDCKGSEANSQLGAFRSRMRIAAKENQSNVRRNRVYYYRE